MNSLGFVFKTLPHSTSSGREGLDALLAASAFCDNIRLFFIGEGVAQLVGEQQPESVLSRNYISTFKLMELYDIEEVFVCEDSLMKMGLADAPLVLDAIALPASGIAEKIQACDKVLTF
ncbi:sulfurtransferase complex subunit TusC [Vibrio marisflavi]|uniref:Protein TusC homolog n=1 Tax=Vibrio marisflavi CECT 7928 TaxID=634439 RepID=A0ABN8E9K4_9VIBR|nr:sulfurtransferase complex subunit TusC [Vibrio marisflavi]CAH0542897.1 Protein TusC [Vibrio marisflavi CECT 7928]